MFWIHFIDIGLPDLLQKFCLDSGLHKTCGSKLMLFHGNKMFFKFFRMLFAHRPDSFLRLSVASKKFG